MRILICGAGALGSSLSQMLVPDLKGEHEIHVLDMDVVETRNIEAGTQFYLPGQEGMNKTEALEYNIYKWFQRNIVPVHGKLVDFNTPGRGSDFTPLMLTPYQLIIDCFDNSTSRELLQNAWRDSLAHDTDMIHAGFSDQFTYAIEWAENYNVPSDITSGFDICQTQGAASFIKMAASHLSLVVQDFLTTGNKQELIGNKFSLRKVA